MEAAQRAPLQAGDGRWVRRVSTGRVLQQQLRVGVRRRYTYDAVRRFSPGDLSGRVYHGEIHRRGAARRELSLLEFGSQSALPGDVQRNLRPVYVGRQQDELQVYPVQEHSVLKLKKMEAACRSVGESADSPSWNSPPLSFLFWRHSLSFRNISSGGFPGGGNRSSTRSARGGFMTPQKPLNAPLIPRPGHGSIKNVMRQIAARTASRYGPRISPLSGGGQAATAVLPPRARIIIASIDALVAHHAWNIRHRKTQNFFKAADFTV